MKIIINDNIVKVYYVVKFVFDWMIIYIELGQMYSITNRNTVIKPAKLVMNNFLRLHAFVQNIYEYFN